MVWQAVTALRYIKREQIQLNAAANVIDANIESILSSWCKMQGAGVKDP